MDYSNLSYKEIETLYINKKQEIENIKEANQQAISERKVIIDMFNSKLKELKQESDIFNGVNELDANNINNEELLHLNQILVSISNKLKEVIMNEIQ